MAKRGRKPKARATLETNVNLIREVSAVVLIVLGIVALLAMFNAGGKVGQGLKSFAFDNFGLVGAILPVAMIIIGFLLLSPNYLTENKKQLVGGILGIVILAALLGPYGGNIGMSLNGVVQSGFGAVGAYIFLLALFILDLIIAFRVSPKTAWEKLNFFKGDRLPGNIRVIEPGGERVSVFTSVKRRIGWGRRPEPAKEQMPLPVPGEGQPYETPPIDLLTKLESKPTSGNIAKNVEIIRKKLQDFGVEVSMGDVNVGPTVTQYQLKPSEGVKLNQITTRSEDLALALAAHPVRIEAPIPGKSAVGVEVPNKVTAKVSLRGMLESEKFKKRDSDLTMALGLDVAGMPITVDLAKLPHLLIAGATGSGKSVCINAIITTFIYQNSPDKLRFILVDPKRVEFTAYNGIPHLLSPVIVDVDKTVNVLKWTVAEMERRFRVFQELGVRDLESYNNHVKGSGKTGADGTTHQQMPNIVVIIDELSDLMAQSANEVEGAIVRLAQMARATGIHLIIATQRPSVNVITGLIKANIPARIAFAVASQVDARTIIDQSGAEKLLGNGDMLYLSADTGKPKRIQGVLVGDKEIKDVTSFLKRHGHAIYDRSIMEFKPKGGQDGRGGEAEDAMYDEAKEVVVRAGKASASLLQRRLKVGYARAARLLDILESNGVIGPPDGAKPRDVYLDKLDVDAPQESQQETSYNYQNPQEESTWPQGVPPPSAPPPNEPEAPDTEEDDNSQVTEIAEAEKEEKTPLRQGSRPPHEATERHGEGQAEQQEDTESYRKNETDNKNKPQEKDDKPDIENKFS